MGADSLLLILAKLALVLGLVLLNGFFVAAEFALVKIRDTQLEPLVSKGNRRALIARTVIRNLDASLSATQLGITLASLGLGWFAEPIFASFIIPALVWMDVTSEHMQHTLSFAVGFTVITFLHIVAGELAPKSVAIQYPLHTSLWVAQPLRLFHRISFPFIWVLNHASAFLLRQFGVEPVSEGELVHSEEELRLLISSANERDGGSLLGKNIVLNALDLDRRIAREVMRPRRELTVFDTDDSIEQCLKIAEETRYSRFPLCTGGDLDHTIGVVHFKDLVVKRQKLTQAFQLKSIARPLIYVPETCKLEKLLGLFLERKLHMAIVVDEYGTTIGMVTLENILEELVGQIQDEFDQEIPLIESINDDEWIVDGTFPIHELEEIVGEDLMEEGISTTSGWVTQRLGGFPKQGEQLVIGNFILEVQEMQGPLVSRIKLSRQPESNPPIEGDPAS